MLDETSGQNKSFHMKVFALDDGPGDLRTERFGKQPAFRNPVPRECGLHLGSIILQRPFQGWWIGGLDEANATGKSIAESGYERPVAMQSRQINQGWQRSGTVDA